MKIDEKNSVTFSRIGSRATFGLVLLELAKKNKNIIAISADTSTSAGLDRLKKQLPDNFLDVGICEQNLIGIATGLSSEGFEVFTTEHSSRWDRDDIDYIKNNNPILQPSSFVASITSFINLIFRTD